MNNKEADEMADAVARFTPIMDKVQAILAESGLDYVLTVEDPNGEFGGQDSNVTPIKAYMITMKAFDALAQGEQQDIH